MSGAKSDPRPKVLIIGIDGATFNLIKPWAEGGKLPTFKHLLDEGVHGEMESIIPPITPPAWASFMTGMNPGKHGLLNFIEHQVQDYSVRYTNGSSHRVPTIWRQLSDLGWRVGVMNIPMTYPPEAVNGFCISGLDTPDRNSDFVYPKELRKELEESVGEIHLDPRHLGFMKTDERRDQVLEDLIQIENRRTELASYLMKHHPVDVMMLVYTAADTAQHFFWNYMDETHFLHDPVGARKYRNAILEIYQMIDANIGRLLDQIPEECTVLLVSDHGGGPVSRKVIYLNQYLQELGLLVYKGNRNRAPKQMLHRLTRGIDGYLRGALTPRQKAWLAGLFPSAREKWELYASSVGIINWEETRAYCLEFLSFPSEIWINLEGRTPHGRVKPGKEYEELITLLTRRLYELKDPETGERLVRKVYRKEEIYHGPYVDLAPDLVLSWWEEAAFQSRKSAPYAGHPSVVDSIDSKETETAAWSGTHRLEGIVLMKGGGFRKGTTLSKAQIIDMAPTLFYLLGLPIPSEMDGSVLFEAFEERFIASRPVQYESGKTVSPEVHAGATYTEAESEKIRERLKGLGYID
jgi:predicted AlkP superfamily phosphohydrolase/phosphomutase